MAQPCPELVFLSGPQQGQRVVLLKPVMIAGRAEVCDVHLAEESASRQHLRFEATPDGCLLEILSTRGVRINGKAFKPGKKILLDTGDCLVVAGATEILFVSADGDPEAALAEYRKTHAPPGEEKKAAPAPAAPAPPPEPAKPAAAVPPPATPAAAAQAKAQADAEVQAKAKAAKTRRYAVLGGVYAVVLVGLIIFLSTLKRSGGTAAGGPPKVLTDAYIEETLREPFVRPLSDTLAAEALHDAEVLYENRNYRPGDLQKCVKDFKLHLAYSHKHDFEEANATSMFYSASSDLIAFVKDTYREAWLREKGNQWRESYRRWEDLAAALPPDTEWDTPGYEPLVRNIREHSAYAKQNVGRRQ